MLSTSYGGLSTNPAVYEPWMSHKTCGMKHLTCFFSPQTWKWKLKRNSSSRNPWLSPRFFLCVSQMLHTYWIIQQMLNIMSQFSIQWKIPKKCGLLHKPHNFPLKVVNLNYCVENDPKAPSECKETSPACCVYKMSTEAELGLSCTLTLYQFLPQYGCSESVWPLFSQINY